MVPWWVMYDQSRTCPERWLEERLQEYDRLLHIRWHRFWKCWCVTRTKRKPGRTDEDMVLAWREPVTLAPKPLSEHLFTEIRSMDAWRLRNPVADWERQVEEACAVSGRRLNRDWRDRTLDAAKDIWKIMQGDVMVARP